MQGDDRVEDRDNLVVPRGASCTLNGTKVEGTISVERGSTLVANGVNVKGNVQSEEFRDVTLRKGSVVVGRVLNSRVNGDVQFFSNEGPVAARRNSVGANLQANPPPPGGGNRAGDKEDQCRAL